MSKFNPCKHVRWRYRHSKEFNNKLIDVLDHCYDYNIFMTLENIGDFNIQRYYCKVCGHLLHSAVINLRSSNETYSITVARISQSEYIMIVGNWKEEIPLNADSQEGKIANLFLNMARNKLGKRNVENKLWQIVKLKILSLLSLPLTIWIFIIIQTKLYHLKFRR